MVFVNDKLSKVIDDPNYVANLDENEITDLLKQVTSVFNRENALLDLKGNIAFVGDTHGDFDTTKAIIDRFFNLDHIIFLGDYIDREPIKWGSIFNVTYLLILKLLNPKKIILLKGNHECNYAISCFPYEFEGDIIQRFKAGSLHEKFVNVFKSMPLMVLANKVFAAHGGIIKQASLDILKNIDKNDISAIESLVWSDPVISPGNRGAGYRFSKDDLKIFLENIDANVLLRGHDYNTLGISIYDDKCLTIFSSRRYKKMGNGGILVAKANKNISTASDFIIEDFSSGSWKKYRIAKKEFIPFY